MEDLMEYLPFLLPLALVHYTLAIIAIVHMVKHPRYRFGNKLLWIIVVLFIQFLGPIAYFVFGRGEER